MERPPQHAGTLPPLYTNAPEKPALRLIPRGWRGGPVGCTMAPAGKAVRKEKAGHMSSSKPSMSIVMPVLNEAHGVVERLRALAPMRSAGVQVIVADGGSADGTVAAAQPLCDRLVRAPRGRAAQMNAGAVVACGDVLVFLHADTILPDGALGLVLDGILRTGRVWGRFDVAIEGRSALLPVVAAMMNVRSRATGIATGDQAMFVTRAAFERVGGFPDIPLMEDIALSRALKRLGPPLCLREKVRTSGRRWDQNGAVRTIVLMWRLRLAFFLGAKPDDLARRYGYAPRTSGQ